MRKAMMKASEELAAPRMVAWRLSRKYPRIRLSMVVTLMAPALRIIPWLWAIDFAAARPQGARSERFPGIQRALRRPRRAYSGRIDPLRQSRPPGPVPGDPVAGLALPMVRWRRFRRWGAGLERWRNGEREQSDLDWKSRPGSRSEIHPERDRGGEFERGHQRSVDRQGGAEAGADRVAPRGGLGQAGPGSRRAPFQGKADLRGRLPPDAILG